MLYIKSFLEKFIAFTNGWIKDINTKDIKHYTFFYINNQKFKQSPRKFLIC